MPEPSSTVAATGAMISIAALSVFSGVDVPTLMGATAGASLFVTSAKDLNLGSRIIYLLISLCMGYLAGPSLLGNYFEHPAVCSFIAAACTVGFGLKLINSVDQIDLEKITKWKKK